MKRFLNTNQPPSKHNGERNSKKLITAYTRSAVIFKKALKDIRYYYVQDKEVQTDMELPMAQHHRLLCNHLQLVNLNMGSSISETGTFVNNLKVYCNTGVNTSA